MARQGNNASANEGAAFRAVRHHRLFRAGSACWFAALFGLSALSIRPKQLEALLLQAGIDGLLPSTAQPLGMVACVLAAAGFAVWGGLIGLGLGHRMALPQTCKARRRHASHAVASLREPAESVRSNPDARIPHGAGELVRNFGRQPSVPDSGSAFGGPPLGTAAERLLAAELTTLSPLELVERLAIAMQRSGA